MSYPPPNDPNEQNAPYYPGYVPPEVPPTQPNYTPDQASYNNPQPPLYQPPPAYDPTPAQSAYPPQQQVYPPPAQSVPYPQQQGYPPPAQSMPYPHQQGDGPPPFGMPMQPQGGYYAPQMTQAGYPAMLAAPPANGMAIASMVLGIIGIVTVLFYGLGIIFAIVAVVLGHISLRQISQNRATQGGSGFAIAGLIIGYIVGVIGILCIGLIIVSFATLPSIINAFPTFMPTPTDTPAL